MQALGPLKGFLSWLVPTMPQESKLQDSSENIPSISSANPALTMVWPNGTRTPAPLAAPPCRLNSGVWVLVRSARRDFKEFEDSFRAGF
jgi:hypothetical protein